MKTMYILPAFAFIFFVAAFPAKYPESSDLSLHLDEGDLETLYPQASAAVNLLSLLLPRNSGFTTDLDETDLSSPEIPRDSRSPHRWYKTPHSTSQHYYKPQQSQHHGESHHYKPQHHVESYHNSYQHYQPAHHYNPYDHFY